MAIVSSDRAGIPFTAAQAAYKYLESPKKSVQSSEDVDSLKYVNDNFGHDSGNELLKAVAEAYRGSGIDAYHISGDEFLAQFDTEDQHTQQRDTFNNILKNIEIEVKDKDGKIYKFSPGVSYGVSENLQGAERKLAEHKASREASGERASRGNTPPGLREVGQGGGRVQGDNNQNSVGQQDLQAPVKRKTSKTLDPEYDSLIVAIAKLGGLDSVEAEAQGVDPSYWKGRRGGAQSGVFGKPWVRRKDGNSFDGMAELLSQHGYFPPGEDYSPNILLDLIERELAGNKVYTQRGYEIQAENEYNEAQLSYNDEDVDNIVELADLIPGLSDSLEAIESLPPNSEIYDDDAIEKLFSIESAIESGRGKGQTEINVASSQRESDEAGGTEVQSKAGQQDLLGDGKGGKLEPSLFSQSETTNSKENSSKLVVESISPEHPDNTDTLSTKETHESTAKDADNEPLKEAKESSSRESQDSTNETQAANTVDEETWQTAESLGLELDDSYPYTTAAEILSIRAGFDHFLIPSSQKRLIAARCCLVNPLYWPRVRLQKA